jgi:hypothetical protein
MINQEREEIRERLVILVSIFAFLVLLLVFIPFILIGSASMKIIEAFKNVRTDVKIQNI